MLGTDKQPRCYRNIQKKESLNMKKEVLEIQDVELETVDDMINALMQVPKDYTLHPLGQKCKMAVDHYHKCVYLDDPNWIGEYKYEVVEEA